MVDSVKLKVALVATILFTILIAIIGIEGYSISKLKESRDSYKRNTETLLSEVDTFRTANGKLAGKVASLELSNRDFKRLMEEDAKTIKKLKAKNEELDKLVKTGLDTEVKVETIVKDTIIYRDTSFTHLKKIEWSDAPWENVKVDIYDDGVAKLDLRHHDEVDVVVFLEYKKFLWWKVKVKGCNVDVISHNPYTTDINVSSVTIR